MTSVLNLTHPQFRNYCRRGSRKIGRSRLVHEDKEAKTFRLLEACTRELEVQDPRQLRQEPRVVQERWVVGQPQTGSYWRLITTG